MKKYRVAYYDFSDSMIAVECIEDYNKVIFEHLDKPMDINGVNPCGRTSSG